MKKYEGADPVFTLEQREEAARYLRELGESIFSRKKSLEEAARELMNDPKQSRTYHEAIMILAPFIRTLRKQCKREGVPMEKGFEAPEDEDDGTIYS